jgi:hypothetical protein
VVALARVVSSPTYNSGKSSLSSNSKVDRGSAFITMLCFEFLHHGWYR